MDHIVPDVRMTMSGRLGRMCNEVIVAYFKVVFQNLSGSNGKPELKLCH
jgi:hypothetical protein